MGHISQFSCHDSVSCQLLNKMSYSRCYLASEAGLRLLLAPGSSSMILRSACCVVGVGLPVYSTIRAIERKQRNEQEQWLLYWTVYGCFSIAEKFSDTFLFWCPYYSHAKFILLVWLQLPNHYGARHIFANYLCPFFRRYQPKLDWVVSDARSDLSNLIVGQLKDIISIRHGLQSTTLAVDQAFAEGFSVAAEAGEKPLKQTDENNNAMTQEVVALAPGHPLEDPDWVDVSTEEK